MHPALTLTQNGNRVWIAYYVQQLDEKLRTDLALLHIDGNQLRLDQTTGLSNTAFDLTPSNITLTPTLTTNFDRTDHPCYDIGEYMSVTGHQRGVSSTDGVVSAWGDNRNTWTGPVGSPEGNMCGTAMRGADALPGSKATSRAKGSHRKLGGLVSGRQRRVRGTVRIGKARSRSR